MISKQDLKTTLTSMYLEKKTGKMTVLGKVGVKSRVGNFILGEGELINATYQGLSGNEAVDAILSLEVSGVHFLPYPSAPETQNPNIRTMSELLTALDANQTFTAEQQAVTSPHLEREAVESQFNIDTARQEIRQLLEEYFGPMANPLIIKLNACETRDEIRLFLKQSRDLIAGAINPNAHIWFWGLTRIILTRWPYNPSRFKT